MNSIGKLVALHPLRLAILPGNGVPEEAAQLYQAAYQTWKLVWKQTLLELDGSDVLYSDDFSRQDYFVALFHGSVCVAVTCFKRVDLTKQIDVEDSWFKPWPPDSLEKISETHRRGLTISWVTVHPDYRRSSGLTHLSDLDVSDRLAEAMNFFIEEARVDVAFGVTRNNRSVNKFSEYGGSITYQRNAVHHGVAVDLTLFFRDGVQSIRRLYPAIAFSIWENRTVYEPQLLRLSAPDRTSKKIA